VTEDDDLDCEIGGVTTPQSQEFEHPDEGDIEERQGHHPPSLARRACLNSPTQGRWMTFSAPTASDTHKLLDHYSGLTSIHPAKPR
jgi:hypothetical protein